MLSMIAFREYLEAHAVVRISSDISSDRTFVFLEVAPDDGDISPFDRMHEELLCQIQLGLIVLSHNEQTRSILIDSMHQDAHPFILSVWALRYAKMMGQGVYKRAAEMAVTRMHYHSGFLIQYKDIVIFIYYIQRNIFRKYLQSSSLIWHDECNDITGTDDIVRLYDLLIDTDILGLYGKLDTMARGVLHMRSKIFVHTHRDLTGSNVEAIMLEHLLLLILICHLVTRLG